MEWSLYRGKEFLEPLVFSNGKTQQDVVNEVLDAIAEGYRFIFIKGVCGTGKSAIALNVAKKIGRASIVVPLKSLQKQYEEDYTNKLKVIKGAKQLKITILTGRKNHRCLFKENCDCDNGLLPCKIEIKEENLKQIKEYLEQNPLVNERDFKTLGDVRRKSIAPVCKYWSPIIPDTLLEYSQDYLKDVKQRLHYAGLKNIGFSLLIRSHGCGYYDQFLCYVNSDVIVFNSKKYELENLMNRKPATEIEIIDECDKFLDDLSNEKKINLHTLSEKLLEISKNARKSENIENKKLADLTWEINNDVTVLINSKEVRGSITKKEILELKNTEMLDLLKTFLANPSLEEHEELEYYCSVAKAFSNFFDETFVLYAKNAEGEMIANLIAISLEKKLKEFTEKNKIFVMMSGTIHSEEVLRNIFGIKESEYKVIEAETEQQGTITRIYTGQEENFRHKAFREGKVTREGYLKALSACIAKAVKPLLIHVNSFADLPAEEECEKYGITNIQSREKIKELNERYKLGQMMQKFKNKKIDVLYSTTSSRGADFPGDICNTIILTKYPYPNVNSLFMRILKRSKPESYSSFYFDKARRDFIQRVYRGLRSKDDHIFLMSPDIKVLNNRLFKYETKS